MTEQLAERIADRCRKTCAVVGVGVSNLPLIRFLRAHGANVTARDRKTAEELGEIATELRALNVSMRLGEGYLDDLREEVIFRTPGLRPDLPAFREAVARGSLLTSEMEWFLELTPATVIGITGSDGKTTTTTLTYLFLEEERLRRGRGGRVFVGGNIGEPLLPRVEKMTAKDVAVVELSSFQLQTVTVSPARAAITNLSPNHLNWHTDMAEYVAAKTNIFMHTGCKMLVTNAENAQTAELARNAPVPVTLFSSASRPSGAAKRVYLRDGWIMMDNGISARGILRVDEIRVPGRHNVENFMTAIALTDGMVSPESIRAVAGRFTGVAHRMERIRTVDGVTYYNSSIDSTPTRTAAALSAFGEMGIRPIVICGGYDKHIPFEPLAEALARHAKAVVLTGATAPAIAGAIRSCPAAEALRVETEPDFRRAVERSREIAVPGDAVLLSPACASFDAFRNFAERGDAFRSIVEEFSEL